MTESTNEIVVTFTKKQWDTFQALKLPVLANEAEGITQEDEDRSWAALEQEDLIIEVLNGGAKGGGKTFFLCVTAYMYAKLVAKRFNLLPQKSPPHVGWIGRKVGSDFVATTLEVWKEVIPESHYRLCPASEKHPRHILIDDRIAIDYGGLDSQKELNKFNSAEYGLIAIDQAEETSKDDVSVLQASRRMKLKNQNTGKKEVIPYRGLYTANPRVGWLKEDFIDDPKPGHVFVSARYQDNRHLPNNYVTTLESAFSHRPDLLKAYRDGNWDALGAIDQVILQEWVTAAQNRYTTHPYVKHIVSVDPARFGDDDCVILGLENTELIESTVLPWCRETQIASEAETMSAALGNCPIVVDEIGVGAGVVDILAKHKKVVIPYNAAKAASDTEKYFNLRAELWSDIAKMLYNGIYDEQCGAVFTFPVPEDDNLAVIHKKICQELLWPWYKFRGKKTLIAPKEDIKEAHSGKSPDYAEAYTQGIWHLKYVIPQVSGQSQYHDRNAPGAVPRRGGRRRRCA